MCGICGITGSVLASSARRDIVARMMRRLAHRGPDGEGLFESPSATLGHRRLSIIDIEHGAQPMQSEDGRYVLVFNGEIYNYLELRQQLIRQGEHFSTFSDTEVLLRMLMREGAQALNKLNGMFAFAFVDTHSKEWLLARDPFGIKPLYLAQLPGQVAFASEIKALFEHPALRPDRDWAGLQEYLTFQFCLGGQTLFKGIRKLEPGTYIRGVNGAVVEETRYWDLSFQVDEQHTEAGYFVDKLRRLLEDSIHLQLRSDVALGTYLSGGLDSSAVTMLARQALRMPLSTFHGRFDEGEQYDESAYARALAEPLGCPVHIVTPTAQQFVDDLPKLIYAMDEPVAGPGLFPQYRVAQLASQHVKVVLGGQGGDEIFGGYARYLIAYLEQALKGAIFETQEEGRHVVTLASVIQNLPLLKNYRPLMQHFWRDGLFEPMDARYFRMIDRSPDLKAVLTPEAIGQIDPAQVFATFQSVFNNPNTKSYFNKMTMFDLKTLLPSLLQVEDRVSMAVSLESRVPLLDTRIAELVASMPPKLKFEGGNTKHVFREALSRSLPAPILERKDKMGFPVPLTEWLRGGPVREFVRDVLLSQRSRERGLFKPAAMARMIHQEQAYGRQ